MWRGKTRPDGARGREENGVRLREPMAPRRGCFPGSEMEKRLRYVAIASLFLIILPLCLFKVESLDFGWHLKAGEYIWTTHSIPTHDIFTYISEGNRWVDSHWLFQLVLYGVHAVGGIPGVIFLRVTLVVATFVLLLSNVYRKEYLPVSILVCLPALFIAHQRFLIRPELVSLFFLAAFFYFAERFSERPRLYLVVIPLCQAIWANMHGLHILGVVFLGLYLAGDALQGLAARWLPGIQGTETTARELRQKGALLVLVLLALLANANGIDGILYPYKIFSELRGEVAYFPMLAELRSPFSFPWSFPYPAAIYKGFLFVSILALLAQLPRIRLAHVLPYLVFLYLSTLALRNMALFAVVATPVTIRNLNLVLDSLRARRGAIFATERQVAAATALSMVLVAAGVWMVTTSNQLYGQMHWRRTFGVGVSEYFSEEVVAHLRTIEGNFFNSPDLGGYLTWKMYPEKKVAMDGRWEIHGKSLPRVLSAYRNPAAFSKLAKEYDISTVVLGETQPATLMAKWLRKSRAWKLTMTTKHTLVFERTRP
jgi:hypothetical protein